MDSKKKAFVLGMARSGYEAARLLSELGYSVVVNDAKTDQDPEHVCQLLSRGVRLELGMHPEGLFDASFELLVKNPGISGSHPYVAAARGLSIPVINELELAYRHFPDGITIIGVTGTNGKTTTATIIYEILKNAGKNAYLMGNIGYPACAFVPVLKAGDIAVAEVSDHQLCDVDTFKTDIAVLTNLSEAHLDFHGSYEVYKCMKKRIFNHHTSHNTAVLNLGDSEVLALTRDILSARRYFTSRAEYWSGCSIIGGYICYKGERIISLDEVKIKGRHNHENAMAAICAVKELDTDNAAITEVLKSFGGVEHRQEYVGNVDGADYYNDSKSTNITSTRTALSSFACPVVLLLGGLDRGHSFEGLRDYLGSVTLIVSYGETRERIRDFAADCGVLCVSVETLKEAVREAHAAARPGYAVLLSPACASWDQYDTFETRGQAFKKYVGELGIDVKS